MTKRWGERAVALGSWLSFTALGLLLIDLDTGPKIVSLFSGHGLTVLDAAGIAALSAGWLALVLTDLGRSARPLALGTRPEVGKVAVVGSGVGLLITALLVPDFSGRGFIIAGFVLTFQTSAALAVLARHDR